MLFGSTRLNSSNMSAWKKYASQAHSTAKNTRSVMTHTIPAFISMRVSINKAKKDTKSINRVFDFIHLELDHYD